jgi:DNA-binding XRE family transcriptional regulator
MKTKTYTRWGERFRSLRLSLGLTQVGMTERFGIPRRTVQQWETNQVEPPLWLQPMILSYIEKRED